MADIARTAETKFHGGFGLALMAAELSCFRALGKACSGITPDEFVPRSELRPTDPYVMSREYYRIIDRIARGEKP